MVKKTTKYSSKDLGKWLIKKADEARNPRIARKILVGNDQRARSNALFGRLYFFKYNPLYGEQMTKYDKFPMVLLIKMYPNGFLGLNLHYLSPAKREALLDLMIELNPTDPVGNNYKFDITWDKIIAFSELEALATPCVHRYRFDRCRSRFIQIYPHEFDMAIQLPVEDWVYNV